MKPIYQPDELPTRVGQLLGTSDWLLIDQARIDAFAQATGDFQWIHVDPVRAAKGPFGSTIAHGFLTLSLLPYLSDQAFGIAGAAIAINYGLNKTRFISVVPVGSRLRGEFRLQACAPIGQGWQITLQASILREGASKPVCSAESIARI